MGGYGTVIVGAGHGGCNVAINLRQQGYEEPVTILEASTDFPHERPPLSKDYLAGAIEEEQLAFRKAEFFSQRSIDIVNNQAVSQIDVRNKIVTSKSAQVYPYDNLIWAAGGRARPLPFVALDAQFDNLFTIRSLETTRPLRALRTSAQRAIILGGGYIGLESAASLRKIGVEVTVIEMMDRVLQRVTSSVISHYFQTLHINHGVDLRLGCKLEGFDVSKGKISQVHLEGGAIIDCGLVIAGIGITPAISPLKEAGVNCGDGVIVDGQCRTSAPSVYAIGDCAAFRNRWTGGEFMRLESVQNASDQAKVVAATILGKEVSYEALPWFWSNQYDVKLQTVGLSRGYDHLVERHGGDGKMSVVYLKDGAIKAVDSINMIKDYVQGRKAIEACYKPDLARLANPAVSIMDA